MKRVIIKYNRRILPCQIFQKLTPLLEHFVSRGPSGCACSVSVNGKLEYDAYIGYADLESKKPIEVDTIYRLYSMSKVVTCAAALMLYERGLYLLNDPLEEYMPEFKDMNVCRYKGNNEFYFSPAKNKIKVKDLFCMSSGLTYPGERLESSKQVGSAIKKLSEKGKYDVRQLSKALGGTALAFEPGTHWKYGLSHDVLGAFIEVLSGKTFGQFLQDEIFKPLGMKDTSFRISESNKKRLATWYNRKETGSLVPILDQDEHIHPDATYESGGGGLLSTLADYSKFAQTLACGGELNGVRILGRKTIDLMSTNHLNPTQLADFDWPYHAGYGYGLGVRVMMDPPAGGSNGSLGEFGWCGYTGTWVLIDPKESLSAVYMQQMFPNFEEYHQPRMRSVIYGAL